MKTKKIILGFINICLLIALVYVTNITNMPDKFIVFQGDRFQYTSIAGIQAEEVNKSNNEKLKNEYKDNTIPKIDTSEEGKVDLKISAFGIPVKDVSVDVIPKTTVIPAGNTIGVKLYTNGVLVIGKSSVEGKDNKLYKPYENIDIEEGDMILEINNKEVSSTTDLINIVNKSNGNDVTIKYRRGQAIKTASITPVQTSKNEYKLGLWVRDGTAGVGTLTFYEPKTGRFAALGHGITDVDTEKIVEISSGELLLSKIMSIKKGKAGEAGELRGSIVNQNLVGQIYQNTGLGIYGNVSNVSALNLDTSKEMEVASRDEIKTGKAQIMCAVENGEVKTYDIEIQKIYKNNSKDNKSMVIKITDEDLINITGGIVQGMSGSPIIQDGKFVGAVTHVLLNDPTKGYGVFADMMLSQMNS